MERIRIWILAIRPKTLPAALAPVIVGTSLAWADGVFSLFPALAAGLVALLLQVGANLANDYFDGINGIDTRFRLGPIRVTQSGLISPESVRRAMVGTLLTAATLGLYLVWVGRWPIALLGVAAMLSALAYSGGPYPLASHGLGDLFVFIFFGPVAVCGTYWVQAQTLNRLVLPASIAIGFLVTAILVVNNLRDIPTDQKTQKITLAVLLGRRNTIVFYRLLVGLAYPLLAVFWVNGYGPWVLLPLLTLPLAMHWSGFVSRHADAALNRALAGTANLTLIFAVLFAIGLAAWV
jgi:1,4-dihydroxy-2-naphthoate octaprenyltransferase